MSFSGAPLAQLNASQPSVTLPQVSVGPAGTFNEIQFVIGTGGDDLRGDSSAIATLQAANGSTLQTIALKQQNASSWNQNTSNTVTAPLNPALLPSQISHVVITLTSHNSLTETDDNWNVQNVSISLSNNGTGPHGLMSFSGAPLARLTGTQPNLVLPPEMATRGLGMTMPVTPPVENLNLVVNTALPTGVLPFGFQVAPSGFLDASSSSMLSGSCSPPAMACLPTFVGGHVVEQDGRLNLFMRTNASSKDAKLLLARAVWFSLGLPPAGAISGMTCGGTNDQCATALAQLAVTGRQAFNSFTSWNPGFAPASSGPQVSDLVQLVQTGYHDVPAIPTSVTADRIQAACSSILNQAYTALWAIRANLPEWRQFRLNSMWIATSGEDDTPHRPVNVPTAPFPQFDIPVPVTVGGQAFTLTTRYMIATAQTMMNLSAPATATAPPVPTLRQLCRPGLVCPSRLAIPSDTPAQLPGAPLNTKNVIVYIHGGGSQLEEAVPLATQFISRFGTWSNNLVVISFDLPDSAYDDLFFTPVAGSTASRIPVDATSSAFENGPNGSIPKNIANMPVLNFTLNFINNFIATLGQQGIIDPHRVLGVMGGSLGGNTSLALGMNPMPAPFHLERPLSFSAPATAPGGAQPTIVSWSVTTMVSDEGNAGLIVGGNMCCIPSALGGNGGITWGPESGNTRSDYISHLYFSGTAPGLPADPEMWYRNDWMTTHGTNAGQAMVAQSRFDRYEIYSPQARLWTTAIDTEQSIASFQHNTDTSGHSYQAGYQLVRARLLLASGACDDYDNGNTTSPTMMPPSMSLGTCANHAIGDTGTNLLNHQDIYGFTHDLANDMRNATGTTLFLNDTGHSIHDERPAFFAGQIFSFLNMPDNNVNVTLLTGSDDLRWNSEVHAVIGSSSLASPMDVPLNFWFHPWPSYNGSPNNPCGACYKLTSFHFPSSNTINNFTIALPPNLNPNTITSFQLKFIAGTSSIGNTTDGWNLAAVAACIPGKAGAFISDGFPGLGTVHAFKPSSNNQAVLWQPPSFQSPSISSLQNNCSAISTNPPPNGDVPSGVWNNGIKF
jgi:hypothetical protein